MFYTLKFQPVVPCMTPGGAILMDNNVKSIPGIQAKYNVHSLKATSLKTQGINKLFCIGMFLKEQKFVHLSTQI